VIPKETEIKYVDIISGQLGFKPMNTSEILLPQKYRAHNYTFTIEIQTVKV